MTLEKQSRYLMSGWINGSFSVTELANRYHTFTFVNEGPESDNPG